jgi:hypothetical protein
MRVPGRKGAARSPGLRARLLSLAGAVAGLCLLVAGPGAAEVVQHGGIRVKASAAMTPTRLPRTGSAPIGVQIGVRITGVGGAPPLLRSISIAINREGRLQTEGLPDCTIDQIQPTTDADALAACGSSLVGEGRFSAQVGFTGQAPFPSQGKVLAFNGVDHGRPAILLHVYGTEPAPTSYTFPLLIGHSAGTYGTTLRATLPQTAGDSGYITGLSLTLYRTYSYRGEARSYLSSGCPAPKGFPSAVFPLARTRLGFAGGTDITAAVTGRCEAAH